MERHPLDPHFDDDEGELCDEHAEATGDLPACPRCREALTDAQYLTDLEKDERRERIAATARELFVQVVSREDVKPNQVNSKLARCCYEYAALLEVEHVRFFETEGLVTELERVGE